MDKENDRDDLFLDFYFDDHPEMKAELLSKGGYCASMTAEYSLAGELISLAITIVEYIPAGEYEEDVEWY